MITIKGSLLLISCLTLLTGCIGFKPPLLEFRPCADPGGISNKTCYYHLTILEKGPDPVVTGQVSKRVLEENRANRQKLGFSDYSEYQDEREYPFHRYKFPVASGFNELVEGNDYWFESTVGQPELKRITVPPHRLPEVRGEERR